MDNTKSDFTEQKEAARNSLINHLKENKNILVHSNPGMGRNTMIDQAASAAGLQLAQFETMVEATTTVASQQKIAAELKNSNAQAMSVSMISGIEMNIEPYMAAAQEANIPLIVSVSHFRDFEAGITMTAFDNVQDMKPVLKEFENVYSMQDMAKPNTSGLKNLSEKLSNLRTDTYTVAPTPKR